MNKKNSSPARPGKPTENTFSRTLFDKLLEIAKTLKNFEGKLSRGKVHRLRVATRRLRAIAEVLAEDSPSGLHRQAQKSVKFLTNQLGEVRSLDVSLRVWRHRFSLPFVESELKKSGLRARKKMAKQVGKKRRTALDRTLQKILRRFRRHRVETYLQAWEKRRDLAEHQARRCYSAFRRQGDIESLHELRIGLKQWRYLLELAGSADANQTVEQLKTLQDDIGEIHDMEVLNEWLKKGRMKRLAQKEKAGNDLKEIRRSLKDDIEAGQKSFLSRQSSILAQIFSKENP